MYSRQRVEAARFFLSLRWQPEPGDVVVRHQGMRVVVCRFCGGDCGQCGGTGRYGYTPSRSHRANVVANIAIMAARAKGDDRKFEGQE
jgi:hypothetical protein